MSVQVPETVAEWAQYVSPLHGENLWNQAILVNSREFVSTLQEEGYDPQEIADVLILFALQFRADEQAPPSDLEGQYLSYSDLLSSIGR